MLDIGFLEQVLVLDLVLAGRVEDLLLDHGVDRQLGADLLDQRLLALFVARLLELLEQVLDLAMVFLEQGDGVGLFAAGHWGTSGVLGVKTYTDNEACHGTFRSDGPVRKAG